MSKFQKMIDEKAQAADYIEQEITYVCKNIPKRDPGAEGETIACQYMADTLTEKCGCESAKIEPFEVHPASFFGWIYITVSLALAHVALYFVYPLIGTILMAIGFAVMIVHFVFYKKPVDFLFPKRTSHNVTAVRKCTEEPRVRVFFNGHVDAAWRSTYNEKFGGVFYDIEIGCGFASMLFMFVFSIIRTCMVGASYDILTPASNPVMFWLGIAVLPFLPFVIGLFFLWDERIIVDGANDNLSGCYIGIAVLKKMEEAGINLRHTEVGVIITGSEEAGVRGAKAWAAAHKHDYDDIPTYIFSYDTIHDAKQLMVNYRELNATVKMEKEVGDRFYNSAEELGIFCKKGMVPPFGGATDGAGFRQGGFHVASITALSHTLEDYYHTQRDTYDNLDKNGLADCYAVTVNMLRHIDEESDAAG